MVTVCQQNFIPHWDVLFPRVLNISDTSDSKFCAVVSCVYKNSVKMKLTQATLFSTR